MTLACEHANSKLVDLLRFGQGIEVEVQARFLSWSLVNILPLMFCRGHMKSNLGRDSEARFGQYFEF